MPNRTTVIGLAIALATALLVVVLVNPATGPRTSRAEFGGTSISIEGMHRQVDHSKLPVHSIPEP
jgi:hypothetical protein